MSRLDYIKRHVEQTLDLPGIIAEAGVSGGDSAEAICEVKGEKSLRLFDTFTGLPEEKFIPVDTESSFNKRYIYPNAYAVPIERVKQRLSEYPNVIFHEGLIPDTFNGLEDVTYCFVHIDLDLYQSTLDALNYFLPRTNPYGLIMVHNYHDFLGVRHAINDAGAWDRIIEGAHKYCFL